MDSAVASAILTYGPLGVFAILLAIGWLIPRPAHEKVVSKLEAEIEVLRDALDHERIAVNEMRSTGGVTNQLIGALVTLAAPEDRKPRLRLGAEDLGLGP